MCFLYVFSSSLSPAYVVRTTGVYVFTGVCLFNFREGGYPISGLDKGVPHARSRGVPHPSSGGGTPPHVWLGGTHSADEGYPIPGLIEGYPILLTGRYPRYPPSKIGWVPPSRPGMGRVSQVPPCPRLDGVPHIQTWDGIPPQSAK